MSNVVIVLGMHRSGTSAVAGALTKLGGAVPTHCMAENAGNPRGYFESVAFMHFHEDLLASAGSSWQDWRLFNPGWYKSPVVAGFKQRAKDLFEAEFHGSALAVLKDPRICRFVPFWLDVLREMQATPHIVMPIRSPLDVAQSLEKLHGLSLTKGMLLWLRHVLDAEVQSRVEARSIFTWNDFQSDWRRISDKISADTGLSWPRNSDRASYEIDQFLSKELVHHETDHSQLVVHSDVHGWTLRAYEALLELARNPFSNSALDTLDQVRTLLDQSSTMFGRILVDYEMGLEDLRAHADALTSERDLLRVRQSEVVTEQAAAATELAARAEYAEKELAGAIRAGEALSQTLAASVAERDALREARARIAAELLSRQQELAEQAAAATELAARAESAEKELAGAIRAGEALSRTLAASVAERDALRVESARITTDLLSRQQELAEKAAAAAEFSARVEQAEKALEEAARDKESLSQNLAEKAAATAELAARAEQVEEALDAAVRDKEALSQTLAASVAERDALRTESARITTDLLSRQRELAEQAAATAEIAARAEQVEEALDAAVRDKQALSQTLAASVAERDALRTESARITTDLLSRQRELAEQAAATAEIAARAERASSHRAAAQDAAHARILAEARKVHEAQRHVLRGQLIDAEAALSNLTTKHSRTGMWATLLPTTLRRRQLARRLIRSGLFDTSWYKSEYPDVERSGLSAAEHYLELGFCRGYKPNPFFDTRSYLERYEDVLISGMNPLLHYLLHGFREGRDPGPDFDNTFYLETNPDVRANGMNPLAHYLRYGRYEGRLPVRPGLETTKNK